MTGAEFEDLYIHHKLQWVELAEKIVKNPSVAEDIVHDAIIEKVLPKIDSLTTKNMDSFVRQAIVWKIKSSIWFARRDTDFSRRQDRKFLFQPVGLKVIMGTEDEVYDPEEEAKIKTPLELSVQEALSKLSDFESDLLCLKLYAGLTFPEIAKTLGVTVYAAKIAYQRLVPKLQLALENVGISGQSYDDDTLPSTSGIAV